MRYFSFWITLLLLSACTPSTTTPGLCTDDLTQYVKIGDTIPLTLCESSYELLSDIHDVHWIITNESGDIVFENKNQNTYFVVPDSGYYSINYFPEYNFRTSLKITVFSANTDFETPYKITLQDLSGTVLGVDTLLDSHPNALLEDIQCEDPVNANFEVYDGYTFTLYGENINDPNETWSDTIHFYTWTQYCLKAEMK